MKRLSLLITFLTLLYCNSLFDLNSDIIVRNYSHYDIKFYLNDEFKDTIRENDTESYNVESGTHKCTAKSLYDVLLIEENVKIKAGHDGIWTVSGK